MRPPGENLDRWVFSNGGKVLTERWALQVYGPRNITVYVFDPSAPAISATYFPPRANICYSLELFIPGVLRQRYPEWEKESLDGIFVARATKTGAAAAELMGMCILISDQTVTPFLVDLELSQRADSDVVTAIRVMLGEPGGGPLGISGPPCNSPDAQRLLTSLADRIDRIAWLYALHSDNLADLR